MAKITHPEARTGYQAKVPAGTPSAAYSATTVGPPVTGTSKEVTPRCDIGNQGRFHRGAKRVWNQVRPRATRSK